MKIIRLISLIARLALVLTLILGLGFWIAGLFGWVGLLILLAQIGFPGIHEALGSLGVLGLFILGTTAMFTQGSRRLGIGSMIYALVVPAFGLAQSMILVVSLHWLIQVAHLLLGIGAMLLIVRIERRYKPLQ